MRLFILYALMRLFAKVSPLTCLISLSCETFAHRNLPPIQYIQLTDQPATAKLLTNRQPANYVVSQIFYNSYITTYQQIFCHCFTTHFYINNCCQHIAGFVGNIILSKLHISKHIHILYACMHVALKFVANIVASYNMKN